MNELRPPRWADRFLNWYCNPDLLEEIQGDLYELYVKRLHDRGKRHADFSYVWDIVRFFRWSNIKRTASSTHSQHPRVWALNFKIVSRTIARNKLMFAVKAGALSLCLAFSLILAAFILHEVEFDKFHINHQRIFRVTSKVNFGDRITHYAVTPFPMGHELKAEIPEIESFTRFLYSGKRIYRIGNDEFHNETTLTADHNFLKLFTFSFIQGDADALNGPNKAVLTKSLAAKFFGGKDPIGQLIEFDEGNILEVAAVIEDTPQNSHIRFDALISWNSFEHYDDWVNLNAYSYVMLRSASDVEVVNAKIPAVIKKFHHLIAREYDATLMPILENIADIHFSPPLDEDIAEKRNSGYLFILIAVVGIFLITGLINYLNLLLAEVTMNLRKIGIIRVFGGSAGNHKRLLLSDALFTLLVVCPLTALLFALAWKAAHSNLAIKIDPGVLKSPMFAGLCITVIAMLIVASQLNVTLLSKAGRVVQLLKGQLSSTASGTPFRKALLTVQLAFSITMITLIIVIQDQFKFIRYADKGFEIRNTIVVQLRDSKLSTIEAIRDRLRDINDIASVGGSSYYPGAIETKYVFEIETANGLEQKLVPMMVCSHDYFEVLNIQVSEGRLFDTSHGSDYNGAYLINEAAAREFGWTTPIGKVINGPINFDGASFREGEVIGVVRDFNFASLHNAIEPMIIFLEGRDWASEFLYIKISPLHRPDLIRAIEKEYHAVWPDEPFEWEYLDSKYQSLYQKDYQIKSVFNAGVVVSVLVSCLGIFSISALLATLRLREMAIRKVLGAAPIQLFLLHSRSFLTFLAASFGIAVPFMIYLSVSWLSNFAYRVELSVYHFLFPGIVALVIVTCISGYHALRITRVNPVNTLKCE